MADHEVTCINKPDRYSQHEHITHIGNPAQNWKITRENAIYRIDNKTDRFYTVDPRSGKMAMVAVVRGDGNKAPYLRTHADGQWNNNLLSLDECGSNCRLT